MKSSSTQSAKQEWAAASDTRRQGNYKNGKIEFDKKIKSQFGTKISVKRGAKNKKDDNAWTKKILDENNQIGLI
jgi:hypothetical protein